MRKLIFATYLNIKNLLISFSKVNQPHIGDIVKYKGEKFIVSRGAKTNYRGDTLWKISNDNGMYFVQKEDFKRCFLWHNIKNGLFSHYNWWKMCWYEVDLDELLNKFQ